MTKREIPDVDRKQMVGVVTTFDGRYYTVVCPDAPAHLRPLYLVRSQMNGAIVGSRVRLSYYSDHRMGYWFVAEVLA